MQPKKERLPPPNLKILKTFEFSHKPKAPTASFSTHHQSSHLKRPRVNSYSDYDNEDDGVASEMADFIVDDDDDDEEDGSSDPQAKGGRAALALKELRKVTRGLGPRENHADSDGGYGSSSDMEARHDEIEEEERFAAKIARKEDARELRRIRQEEEDERRRKRDRKMRDKGRRD